MSLRKNVFVAISWVGLLQILRKFFAILVSILIYRRLSVEDIGFYALLESYLSFVVLFSDLGIEDVVLQRQGQERYRSVQVALAIKTLVAIPFYFLVLLISPVLGGWHHAPALNQAFPIVSLAIFLNIFISKYELIFKKELAFGKMIVPDAAAQMTSIVTSIALVLVGWGYWALIAASLAHLIVKGFVYYFGYKIVPMDLWPIDRHLLVDMLHSAKYNFLTNLVSLALLRTVYFVIAKQFSLEMMGWFSLAFNWSNFFVTFVLLNIQKVLFPAVSNVSDDLERVKSIYAEYLHSTVFAAVFFCGILFLYSDVFIHVLVGAKWEPAVILCQFLAFQGLFRSLQSPAKVILSSLGKFKVLFYILAVEYFLLGLSLLFLWPLQIRGVCLAMIISKAIAGFICVRYLDRILNAHLLFERIASPYIAKGGLILIAAWLLPLHGLLEVIVLGLVYLVLHYRFIWTVINRNFFPPNSFKK